MTVVRAISATMTPTVHQRTRYRAAGADWSQKRARSLRRVSRAPVIRPRAAATRAADLGDELGVRGAGADAREVPRSGAVEAHELVGLRPVQPASARELVQPVPLVAVRSRIRVDVHGRSLT